MKRPDPSSRRRRGRAAPVGYAEVATVTLCALLVAAAVFAQMNSLLPAMTP